MTVGYRGLDQMIQDAQGWVRTGGGRMEQLGTSVEGRPIWAGHLPGAEPGVLVVAGIHGLEWIGIEVVLHFLREAARAPLGVALTAVPVANPDGVAKVERCAGRGPLRTLRTNANGVDLNRNFPRPGSSSWHPRWPLPFSGSARPGAATYRGPHPLSEPESAALARLVEVRRFAAAASVHSFMGTLIPPRLVTAEQEEEARLLLQAFQAGGGGRYRLLGSRWLDTYTGEWEDYLFHVLGVRAVCIESFAWWESLAQRRWASTLFDRFNPASPAAIAERDAAGLRAWLMAARGLPPVAHKRLESARG